MIAHCAKLQQALEVLLTVSPREAGFDITVASEVMAILCLAKDLKDLQNRLGDMIVAYRRDRSPIFARDIKADGAMTVLLKDAMQPILCKLWKITQLLCMVVHLLTLHTVVIQ